MNVKFLHPYIFHVLAEIDNIASALEKLIKTHRETLIHQNKEIVYNCVLHLRATLDCLEKANSIIENLFEIQI